MNIAYKRPLTVAVTASRNCVVLLRQHWKTAVPGFLCGSLLWFSAGTLWPKHYTGSAIIAVNPQMLPTPGSTSPEQHAAVTPLLREAAAKVAWADAVTRFQLYPEIVSNGGVPKAAAQLASQVAIIESPSTDAGERLFRISYSGTDSTVVLGVAESIVDGFIQPAPAASTAKSEEPLYAPVNLPTSPPPIADIRHSRRAGRHKVGRKTKSVHAVPTEHRNMAEIQRRLQASIERGATIEDALGQNAAALDDLRKQQEKNQATAALASEPQKPQPTTAERKHAADVDRARQELAKAQHALAVLYDRHNDNSPEAAAARGRVQDLQLDLSRIVAAAPPVVRQAPPLQPAAKSVSVAEVEALARQVSQAEDAQLRLKESLDRNHAETAKLQAELAQRPGPSVAAISSTEQDTETAAGETTALSKGSEPFHSANQTGVPASMELQTPLAHPINHSIPPFFLVKPASVATSPFLFTSQLLWFLSLVFGTLTALLAAWIAERHDPSIRNESMLRNELPASAVYLGGIPRIRHEVVTD